MRGEPLNKGERVAACVTGGVLTFLGLMGLMLEFEKAMPTSKNFSGYLLSVVLVVCGLLTCIAVWSHYSGGLWSLFGLLFVAAAMVRLGFAAEAYMGGRHLISRAAFISTTVGLWGAGCYCLFWGHIRRQRRKKDCHSEDVTP